MIGAGEVRKGIAIELDGEIYRIEEYQHVKMQQRSPTIRLRLRNVRSGNIMEKSFSPKSKFTPASLEHCPVQYLYEDGGLYYFLDQKSYEQIVADANQMGEAINYLREGLNLEILVHNGKALSVDLPIAVELKVMETQPGFRGDTVTAGTKPAKLETGLGIQIPLFLDVGDIVKIDTRTGEYLEKVT